MATRDIFAQTSAEPGSFKPNIFRGSSSVAQAPAAPKTAIKPPDSGDGMTSAEGQMVAEGVGGLINVAGDIGVGVAQNRQTDRLRSEARKGSAQQRKDDLAQANTEYRFAEKQRKMEQRQFDIQKKETDLQRRYDSWKRALERRINGLKQVQELASAFTKHYENPALRSALMGRA